MSSHIGTTFAVTWSKIQQARIINLYKRGVEEKKSLEWNFWKICMSIQTTMHLVLFYIDSEVSQLWPSPSDQAGIFSMSFRIALFPHHAGSRTTTSVYLQSVNFFNWLKLFYIKSNLFNMCISTCFLFTSVGWCNVPVHLKFIHKVKYHF